MLNVGTRPRRRVRVGRRDRPGQGRARRAPCRPTAWPSSTRDDPPVAAMARGPRRRVVMFGEHGESTCGDVDPRRAGAARRTTLGRRRRADVRVTLAQPGGTRSATPLPVAAIALEVGRAARRVAETLAPPAPVAGGGWRSPSAADGVMVVNDAYNANPDSMRAALQALADIGVDAAGAGRRPRRDARARATVRSSTPGDRRAWPPSSASTCWWASATSLATWSRLRGGRRRRRRLGARRRTPPTTCSRRCCAAGDVVLLKSSRDAGLRWLGDRCGMGPDATRRRTCGRLGPPSRRAPAPDDPSAERNSDA